MEDELDDKYYFHMDTYPSPEDIMIYNQSMKSLEELTLKNKNILKDIRKLKKDKNNSKIIKKMLDNL